MSGRVRVVAAALACLAGLAGPAGPAAGSHRSIAAATASACAPSSDRPLWIDYGEGAVPKEVRDVLARPGVTLAASGTALPATYRAKGAATVHFVRDLPRLVGAPDAPADPGSIAGRVDETYARAVASTGCETPIVGLNELAGPAAPLPWSATVRAYRANVLALVRGLAARGARPALLIHGNPLFGGEATAWWRQVGGSADVVYEAYYKAPVIVRLGRIVGPRRVRLGMRSVAAQLVAAGIPPRRIGFVLGFQVAPGTAGREGLQPSSDWYRYVKWNAIAARQVAGELGASSVWSWGWGTFGARSVDPDKPRAACVYLWARDPSLCDGPAAAGAGFVASRVEGAIVLPPGVACVSAAGRITDAQLADLTRVVRTRSVALAALFQRLALQARVPVTGADVIAAEQRVIGDALGGSRDAYLAALAARHATLAVARGALGDDLRRQRIASLLASGAIAAPAGTTVLAWSAGAAAAEADTATCRGDVLPGLGDFPASNTRDVASAPILLRLPFLGADHEAPATPASLVAMRIDGGVALTWADVASSDVIGYAIFRRAAPGAPLVRLVPLWTPRSSFVDRTAASVPEPSYVVRAVDASGNVSAPTPETPASG